MSESYRMQCEVCREAFDAPGYVGVSACLSCGTEYEYEEGTRLILSPEQSECLRRHRIEWGTPLPPFLSPYHVDLYDMVNDATFWLS